MMRERRTADVPAADAPVRVPSRPHELLALQRAAGNRAVSRLLAARTAERGPSGSPAMRGALRGKRALQRHIRGEATLRDGTFKIDFRKHDGVDPGDRAYEDGTITFTPNATAPESDSIRFVQTVLTTDKSGAGEVYFDYTDTEEEPRMSQMTALEPGVLPGWYIDQSAASLSQRTRKSDPIVPPYYDATGPKDAGVKIGKRKGTTIEPAVLFDAPGDAGPGRTMLLTAAHAADTGWWYGTVAWGFEIYLDEYVPKIMGEYMHFREGHPPTVDAALRAFDEYYRNPGASTAPTE